jgi:hypothetical protein
MKRMAMVVGLVALTGCLPEENSYSPEKDDRAMAVILGEFDGQGVNLSLCEDVATAEEEPRDGCMIEHVIRAGGLGDKHRESHSNVGCGGCPFYVQAYVRGHVVGGEFDEPVAVRGEVSPWGGDGPYSFPYSVYLRCEDEDRPCRLGGYLQKDGRLELQFLDPDRYEAEPLLEADLDRLGDVACSD